MEPGLEPIQSGNPPFTWSVLPFPGTMTLVIPFLSSPGADHCTERSVFSGLASPLLSEAGRGRAPWLSLKGKKVGPGRQLVHRMLYLNPIHGPF